MEDWQGCLSPLCQTALQEARRHVLDRGGHAITVEDFLLALIDCAPGVSDLLRRRGVDLDELTRTIQCEQPIITVVHGEGLLSSQLLYWLSIARECLSGPWLEWPGLLRILVDGADRLSGKAYVAVLEQVSEWPEQESSSSGTRGAQAESSVGPVVVTELAWLQLAEELAVTLAARPKALIWLCGPAGSGKTTWLQALAPSLQTGFLNLDLRLEAEVMASEAPVFPVDSPETPPPLLILDNISPRDLCTLCRDPEGLGRQIVPAHRGPILLLSPPTGETDINELESWLGRSLERVNMPVAGAFQLEGILTAHQARIERQWGVELTDRALRFAGSAAALAGLTPGQAIEWLSRAAARVLLMAKRGPWERHQLAGKVDTLNRQMLVAVARNQSIESTRQALDELAIEQAAVEVDWYERRARATLFQVTVADLEYERERWWLLAETEAVTTALPPDQAFASAIAKVP